MDLKNVTRISTIHLLGFQIPQRTRFLAFFIFILIYCVTICGNLLIITLVVYSKTLHSPMYFFLSQLSLLDILLVTDIIPSLIYTVLVKHSVVLFFGCLTQFYFFVITEISECVLLTVMSYDRYLAICKPLHYPLTMNHQACCILLIVCWTLGVLVALVYILTISSLQFCGPHVIDHFFCDLHPLLQLSCSDTAIVQKELAFMGNAFIAFPFFIIIVSYVYIIITIFKIPSITGRQKVFSTCSSHLTVVSIYYGTLVCVYMVPRKGQTTAISKLLSLIYTLVTPMMNPIIYSLRNKELNNVVGIIINKVLNRYFRKNPNLY